MQIEIQGVGLDVSDALRAYVEYRMFSAASRFDGHDARLSVRLEPAGLDARARYRCVASMERGPARALRVSASSDLLHAAVDRAAERLSRSAERRLARTAGEGSSRAGLTLAESEARPGREAGS